MHVELNSWCKWYIWLDHIVEINGPDLYSGSVNYNQLCFLEINKSRNAQINTKTVNQRGTLTVYQAVPPQTFLKRVWHVPIPNFLLTYPCPVKALLQPCSLAWWSTRTGGPWDPYSQSTRKWKVVFVWKYFRWLRLNWKKPSLQMPPKRLLPPENMHCARPYEDQCDFRACLSWMKRES